MVFALALPLAAMPDMAWGVGGPARAGDVPGGLDRRAASHRDDQGTRGHRRAAVQLVPQAVVEPRHVGARPGGPVLRPYDRDERRPRGLRAHDRGRGSSCGPHPARAARHGRPARPGSPGHRARRRGNRRTGCVVRRCGKVRGARELEVRGRTVRVFAIPGARPKAIDEEDRQIMIATWAVAGLTLLFALVGAVRGVVERRRRKPVPLPLADRRRDPRVLLILRGLEGGQQRGNTYRRHHRLHRRTRSGRSHCRGRRPDAAERRREADLVDERELRLQQLKHRVPDATKGGLLGARPSCVRTCSYRPDVSRIAAKSACEPCPGERRGLGERARPRNSRHSRSSISSRSAATNSSGVSTRTPESLWSIDSVVPPAVL